MECCFCKNTYLNTHVLKHHQATSKKCIIIQQNIKGFVPKEKFQCKFCSKELSTKNRVLTHQIICKKKIQHEKGEIHKIKDEIDEKMNSLNYEKMIFA